jgi:hypothetical protein
MYIICICFASKQNVIYLVGGEDNNDLYMQLNIDPNLNVKRTSATLAISSANKNDKVLFLANSSTRTPVPLELFKQAKSVGFLAYIEFPETRAEFRSLAINWKQRIVVTSSEMSSFGLEELRILQLQGATAVDFCQSKKCNATINVSTICKSACANSILSFAQIAGVDTAAFGVKDNEKIPLLFYNDSKNVMISAAPLSNMIKGRSAPQEAWRKLWGFILNINFPRWEANVRPTYSSPTAKLNTNALENAVFRSSQWISNGSKLMTVADIQSDKKYGCCKSVGDAECVLYQCTASEICPAPFKFASITNITCLQEGWSSIVHQNGSQHYMPLFIRTDGNAEAAMALASAATLISATNKGIRGHHIDSKAQQNWRNQAGQLLDYMFRWSSSQTYEHSNSSDPKFGIVWWNQKDAGSASGGIASWSNHDYGSNTGCILIGATASAALLKSHSWRNRMLYAMFAEIRTTGRNGYRPNVVSSTQLEQQGWKYFFNDETIVSGVKYSPHYGAQPAAYFLFAGHSTGLKKLFHQPAVAYIKGIMAGLKMGNWTWTQSMTNELGTLVLTLAWYVRSFPIDSQGLIWLEMVVDRLLLHQTEFGAIKQFFGTGIEKDKCHACVPNSNAEYGDGEAPLMFSGNETITDCLYSLNFIAIGLREAFVATGKKKYSNAEEKLMEYLIRIQVTSKIHPELDGSWFRAFEYSRWEYWASDSDWGYGPWVTDDGWTNGWIQTSMALKLGNTSLWDVMKIESDQWNKVHVKKICDEMLLDESDIYCETE